jgi:hypothetical protein
VGAALKDHGVPLQYAAAILGHTNGALSYDRYGGDISLEMLKEVMATALSSFADAEWGSYEFVSLLKF